MGFVAAGLGAVVPQADAQAQAAPQPLEVVLGGENNRLHAYDATTGAEHVVVPAEADAPGTGLDINAEICIVPDGVPWKPDGELWFIAGEDTEQNTVAGVIKQGWGIFRLTGTTLDTLAATEIAKLVPDSFVTQGDNPENYGCGVLPDGRLITGDVGDQLPQSPATGQLIEWFITADLIPGHPTGADRTEFPRVPHCKIDVAIGTAGGIAVEGTDVYIASNRPDLTGGQAGGIYRYDSTVWPTGETAGQGCGRADATGQQLADADKVGKSLFIPQTPGLLTTPSDIVDSGHGTWYISSVFTGNVVEYGKDGVFRRPIVTTAGQAGGITPYGMGVTRDGTLWIADIGVVGDGPAPGAGSVVRVRFDAAGQPGQPETIDENLEFPDGIGVATVVAAGASAPSEPSSPTGPTTTSGVGVDLAGPAPTTSGRALARTGGGDALALPVLLATAAAALLVVRRRASFGDGVARQDP